MPTIKNVAVAATGALLVAVVMSGCGSSGSPAASSGTPTGGPGLTQPTSPGGTRMSGGTVYFTKGTNGSPNYIFPMYSFAVCNTANVNQFMDLMYRPLYWYGNDYRPTVDCDYSIGQAPVFSNGDRTVTNLARPRVLDERAQRLLGLAQADDREAGRALVRQPWKAGAAARGPRLHGLIV